MMSLNEAILAKYARASRFSVAVAFWRQTNPFSSLVLNITFIKDRKCRPVCYSALFTYAVHI